MPSTKHLVHCFFLCAIITGVQYLLNLYNNSQLEWKIRSEDLSDETYTIYCLVVVSITIGISGRLAVAIIGLMALIIQDCFPGPVKLGANLRKLPLISFRTVTKGNYPDLVKSNVEFNKKQCLAAGLSRFVMEIVTEKKMDFPEDERVKQIVVPQSYSTKRGTLFKGRNLQYCLEEGVSEVRDDDWILHLDEDSLLTESAVIGLSNFIQEGKRSIGQGLILYDQKNITTLPTKILNGFRTFKQLAYLRTMYNYFGWFPTWTMGSFVACKVRTEKEISFDGGPTASILEFFYLSLSGHLKGYRVGWIEGELHEMGPLTVRDAIDQNTRGFEGGFLLLKNKDIRGKAFISQILTCSWMLGQPMHVLTMILTLILQYDYLGQPLLFSQSLIITFDIYQGNVAIYKYNGISTFKYLIFTLANLFCTPIYAPLILSISVFKGLLEKGLDFKVTKKTM